MLSVVMLNVIMQSVVAPKKICLGQTLKLVTDEHSCLSGPVVSDDEKKVYNINNRWFVTG
jgi:hypothetical protein